MKKNGFTLVELISVVVILGIISLIATPSIIGLIDKGNAVNENVVNAQIIDAAKEYVSNNNEVISSLIEIDDTVYINLQSLIDFGLIDIELIENAEIDVNSVVEVKLLINDELQYELVFR